MQILKRVHGMTVEGMFLIVLYFFTADFGYAQESPPGLMVGQPTARPESPEPGLLFYLSGDNEFTADFAAGGQVQPNYLRSVDIIADGAVGSGIEADDDQLMSYWAPGNIYAQRGTLSFFWRSRYPAGPTPFPVFRVGYADHSSWDMVWLRIDFNGSGFDAFVTDVGNSRTRVSHYMDEFPEPDEWTHITLSWDETEGIRFYINGEQVEEKSVVGKVYDTGLDQFGPHSRIISPYQVQSAYNFMRGGDVDEIRIYDRMLSDENIRQLSQGESPDTIPELNRNMNERRWRDSWWTRHGWNLPNEAPPLLSPTASVKKVEIHDAIDIKRWYWKANDGIRETTWPAVYNMSRLPGRYDYFVLPDWDTYSMGGQTINFYVPENKPWNHIEMWGTAWGQLTHESDHPYNNTFAERTQNQVKSYYRTDEVKEGGVIRFDNALIEEPIGSFMLFHVDDDEAPRGTSRQGFELYPAPNRVQPSVERVKAFIQGRYPADERTMMAGVHEDENAPDEIVQVPAGSLPIIHAILPYNQPRDEALDGILLELPALDVKPTHDGAFPVNIRVKDPLWEMRDLLDFSFSVKPGESQTIWFDTRDRILPEDRSLYFTLSGAGQDLTVKSLQGTKVHMIYKSHEDARAEHELDRFTQVRDLHAHNVEENPRTSRLNSYNRFYADINDLLDVNPDHWLGQAYWFWVTRDEADKPDYEIPPAPDGIPEWAYLQTEYLRHLERIVMYYIDERQISNGEFGGGLSDDGDFTNFFPGTAFLGIQPEKILESLRLHMEAYYDYDRDPYDAALKQPSLPLFTNGLATIQADELHAYEEGIEVVGQLQLFDYGNPLYINRGMETAKRVLEDITQISPDGHRRFRSRYYSGTKMSVEDPWQWSVSNSFIMLHTPFMIVRHNGNPDLRRMVTEIADGLLENMTEDGEIYTEIHFETGEYRGNTGIGRTWNLFMAAYDYTGDEKYLEPIPGYLTETREFNKEEIADAYRSQIHLMGVREYISTEGSLWIDRVQRDHPMMQEHRLGGVALLRANEIYPRHKVSWDFKSPASYESVAIYLTRNTKENIDLIAYNLEEDEVAADMTVWDVEPGRWKIVQGLDSNEDQQMDANRTERIVDLERGEHLRLDLAPRVQTVVQLELVEPAATGYWERPDLGIGPNDIRIDANEVIVRVHSLGAIDSPETTLELRDAGGELVATRPVPSLEAPLDLIPRWTEVQLTVPEGTDLSSGSVTVDPEHKIKQITRRNTTVKW